ncbi:unnamed protein product [Rotaria socialis]|uniref:Uncharacterized protein n=2 Tax=Rotaria TaxID=231623 RepID=A0A820Y4E0_9BILA|nr:unnamed protein product [Rotaria socialis]
MTDCDAEEILAYFIILLLSMSEMYKLPLASMMDPDGFETWLRPLPTPLISGIPTKLPLENFIIRLLPPSLTYRFRFVSIDKSHGPLNERVLLPAVLFPATVIGFWFHTRHDESKK